MFRRTLFCRVCTYPTPHNLEININYLLLFLRLAEHWWRFFFCRRTLVYGDDDDYNYDDDDIDDNDDDDERPRQHCLRVFENSQLRINENLSMKKTEIKNEATIRENQLSMKICVRTEFLQYFFQFSFSFLWSSLSIVNLWWKWIENSFNFINVINIVQWMWSSVRTVYVSHRVYVCSSLMFGTS